MINYSLAQDNDLEAITSLLKINNLPYSDIQESPVEFIVAKSSNEIIGCIGVEIYKTDGLLRSFTVENNFRNKGIGKELYHRLLSYSAQSNVKTLHLLTNTAEEYFSAQGFIVANRSKAPELIKNSKEFASLCPASSFYMVLVDISKHTQFYDGKIQKKQTDFQTNSVYWAIRGNKVMITHFTVPPKAQFDTHSHDSEQITHVLSGDLYFNIKGQLFRLDEGDSVMIPSNIPHSVYSENGAVAVDAWSPVNETYF
jgi:amino-acid N-acetyltransferase